MPDWSRFFSIVCRAERKCGGETQARNHECDDGDIMKRGGAFATNAADQIQRKLSERGGCEHSGDEYTKPGCQSRPPDAENRFVRFAHKASAKIVITTAMMDQMRNALISAARSRLSDPMNSAIIATRASKIAIAETMQRKLAMRTIAPACLLAVLMRRHYCR